MTLRSVCTHVELSFILIDNILLETRVISVHFFFSIFCQFETTIPTLTFVELTSPTRSILVWVANFGKRCFNTLARVS